MPSSLFADMDGSGLGVVGVGGVVVMGGEAMDEQRALQLALDQLSLLGLDHEEAVNASTTAAGSPSPSGVGAGVVLVQVPGGGGPQSSCSSSSSSSSAASSSSSSSSVSSSASSYLCGGNPGSDGGGGIGGPGGNGSVCIYTGEVGPDPGCMFEGGGGGGGGGGGRRSVNMTECVPVPSSEHVAEIVGRQGCKIKALRAKTNTYIKTPVRGEEPLFVVTGRREDVALAKREILSAAEHFSMIRASRSKPGGGGGGGGVSGPGVPPPPNLPGQTTIQVRVPYRVVGLVVGPKGATIKRIQQTTHTYIVTPSRDKEPVFEVTGMPENVDRAREEIEAHIALRTGCGPLEFNEKNDFHTNGTDVGFEYGGSGGGGLGSLWIRPTPGPRRAMSFASYRHDSGSSMGSGGSSSSDSFFNGAKLSEFSPISPFTGSGGGGGSVGSSSSGSGASSGFVFESASSINSDDRDLGFESPGFDPTPGFDPAQVPATAATIVWSQFAGGERSVGAGGGCGGNANGFVMSSRRSYSLSGGTATPRLSPTLSDSGPSASVDHPLARRARSDPLGIPGYSSAAASASTSPGASSGTGSTTSGGGSSGSSRPGGGSRDCLLCAESVVIAALVPCGHNLFCMECANRICEKPDPVCPVCKTSVTQAIRIFS
ncbi:RNA-binding protein MEX3B [Lampetra fluviatilis]